jgi:hypothetical protein
MLEKREDRVKLLKAGLSGKMIEKLYIEGNHFKLTHFPPVIELLEIDMCQNVICCIRQEVAVKCS